MHKLTREERRVLRITGSLGTTTTWPSRNGAIRSAAAKGLIEIGEPRPHKHYVIVDIVLTPAGRAALEGRDNG